MKTLEKSYTLLTLHNQTRFVVEVKQKICNNFLKTVIFCGVNPVNHDSVLKMVKEKDHDMVLAKNAKIQVEQLMNGDEESPIRR